MDEFDTTQPGSNFDEICQMIDSLTADNLKVRSDLIDDESKFSRIKRKLSHLSENLSLQKNDRFRIEESMIELLDVVMAMSSMDFSKRVEVRGQDYIFDAIALGLNGVMDVLSASAQSMRYNDNMLKSLTDMVVICNESGTILAINEVVTAALGYKESELTGLNLEVLLDEDANEAFGVAGIAQHNSLDGIETTFINKDQKKIYVSMSTSTVKNEEGEVERIVCVAREMTEQRLMDEALNNSNRRLVKKVDEYQGILSSVTDVIMKRDDNGEVLFVSPSVETITGYSIDEWKASYRDCLTDRTDNRIFLNKPRKKFTEYEVELSGKDGKTIWIEVKESAEFENKKLVSRIAVARDISETRYRSAEQEQAQRFFKSVVDKFPYLITVKDVEDLSYIQLNKRGEELLGLKRDDVIGRNDYQLFREEEAECSVATDRQAINSGELVEVEDEIIETPHKGSRIFKTSKILIKDDDGPDYLLTVSEDVTEQKQDMDSVVKEKDTAINSNRSNLKMVTDLISILQSSLKSSVTDSDILWKHCLFRLARHDIQALNRLSANDRRAIGILKEIAEIIEIESGEIELDIKPVQLTDLIREAVDYSQGAANSKGVSLNVELPDDIDSIETDRDKLFQLLLPLIDNALSYTDQGSVTVRVVTGGSGSTPIRVEVQDNGCGISSDEMLSIFSPFYRGSGQSANSDGAGLGLTTAKALCHALGYRLRVSSEVGNGSLFTVSLKDR